MRQRGAEKKNNAHPATSSRTSRGGRAQRHCPGGWLRHTHTHRVRVDTTAVSRGGNTSTGRVDLCGHGGVERCQTDSQHGEGSPKRTAANLLVPRSPGQADERRPGHRRVGRGSDARVAWQEGAAAHRSKWASEEWSLAKASQLSDARREEAPTELITMGGGRSVVSRGTEWRVAVEVHLGSCARERARWPPGRAAAGRAQSRGARRWRPECLWTE